MNSTWAIGKAGILAFSLDEGEFQKWWDLSHHASALYPQPKLLASYRQEQAGITRSSRGLGGGVEELGGALLPRVGNCGVACPPGLLGGTPRVPQHLETGHREDSEGHSVFT